MRCFELPIAINRVVTRFRNATRGEVGEMNWRRTFLALSLTKSSQSYSELARADVFWPV